MEIRKYVSDLLSSNMYVLVEDSHAIVIDPFRDAAPAEGLTVDHILLTHEHYDHISGVNEWKRITGAPVLCSKACAENIQNPRKNLANHFKDFCELQTWVELDGLPDADAEYACQADETFEDKKILTWRGHTFILFEMPGHSPGSTGILLDGRDFFSGDSLIKGHDIALRFPGGSRTKWKTVGEPRLATIPAGTRIWPGHFDSFVR